MVFGHRVVVDRRGCEVKRLRQPAALHPRPYALLASGCSFPRPPSGRPPCTGTPGELDEVLCRRYAMDFDWFGRLSLNLNGGSVWMLISANLTEHEGRVTLQFS